MARSRRQSAQGSEPTEATAEKKVEQAQQAVEEARDQLVEAQGELRTVVFRDVPQMVVRVKPNSVIVHEGKAYHGGEYGKRDDDPDGERLMHGKDHGDEVTMDGPTAFALVMEGHVDVLRSEGV